MLDMSILLQKAVESIGEVLGNSVNLEDMLVNVRKCTDTLALGVIQSHIESIDTGIRESIQRKKDWYTERRGDIKSITTGFGVLSFERTYYRSKRKSEYIYLLDCLMGIEGHQRLDKGYQDALISESTLKSYENASLTAGKVKVSRQTVKSLIHKMEPESIKKMLVPETKRKVENLYIDADEDHVSVLRGKTLHQDLLYVYEGKKEGYKRNELVKPYYITGVSGKDLFLEAWEYIRDNYDTEGIKRIYVQGDGAKWIRSGVSIIPNSRFVLDRYHLSKYVNDCTGGDAQYKAEIYSALDNGDYEALDVVMNRIIEKGDVSRDRIYRGFQYLYSNFDGITIRNSGKEKPVGCSAESHVSHILSARLSSRPLTWSVHGADNMAKIRVYLKNGGNLKELRYESEYIRKVEEQYKGYIKTVENRGKIMYDDYNNVEVLRNGHNTGLYKVLKMIRGIC